MSKTSVSVRVLSSSLLSFLAASVASAAVGCSKPEEEKTQAWSCASDEVPMGEVVRCTSAAVTLDGPLPGSSGGTTSDGTTSDGTTSDGTTSGGTSDGGTTSGGTSDGGTTSGGTSDGTSDDGTTTYDCEAGADPQCPPSEGTTDDGAPSGGETSSGGTSSGGTADGTSDGTSSGGTPDDGASSGGASGNGGASSGGASGNGGASSGGNGNGSGNGGTADGTGPGNSSKGGGAKGGSKPHTPHECSFCPDLQYCTHPSGPDGGNGDGNVENGNGKNGNGSSSSGGSKNESGGKGKVSKGTHFTCKKDSKGNRSCVSTPNCATGHRAAKCGACVPEGEGTSDCVPPSEGGCWVTGGGFVEGESLVPAAPADGHDNFGGNAKPMKRGDVSGHWNHVDHGTGNHAKGRPEYIMCRTTDGPGPGQPGGKKGLVANQVYFGGHAQWRTAADGTWQDGYWFDVVAEDHGEPGNTSALKNGQMPDSYHFTIRKIDDAASGASGAIVYETRGDLKGGNIQLHPSNGGHPAVNSPLPAWVSIER